MWKPKVLYAIQGTGNGHISRARTLLPYFERVWDVSVLISGNQVEVELPKKPTYQKQGLVFKYNRKGGISNWKTLIAIKPLRLFHELISLDVKAYDFVLTDFECLSAWACKFRDVPCLGLSHQAAVLMPDVPKPKSRDWLGALILRWYAPCKNSIGFHFQIWQPQICAPIIKEQLCRDTGGDHGYYLVYLPAFSKEAIAAFLMNFPEHRFVVFHKAVSEITISRSIEWHPISATHFELSMLYATGVVTSAGFETPAEALYMRKKLLIIPIKGQYEQKCNAAALQSLWVPVMRYLDPDFFEKWLWQPHTPVEMNRSHPTEVIQKIQAWMNKVIEANS
jgi:uncharacterized protein (TIGR00661 family)